MNIVRADFLKECDIFELPEELFDDRLVDHMDEYLETRRYIDDYPDHIILNSKANIVQFLNTENGNKIFMGLYFENDTKRLNLLIPIEQQ